MAQLSSGVGVNQANLSSDVKLVQTLLNEHPEVIGAPLVVDGEWGPNTLAAVVAYQSEVVNMANPDGVLSPNGPTFASLVADDLGLTAAAEPPVVDGVPALLAPQPMPVSVLTAADFATAAATLGCEVAAIQAVLTVETGGAPFDPQGRPTILYERHLFSRATHGAYDAIAPDISDPTQTPRGGYGGEAAQYPKMIRAAQLGPNGSTLDAALGAASWGMFQILGQNYVSAGFTSVEAYVAAMRSGVGAHLQAFVHFLKADAVKVKALQTQDWATFAARYNGPNYAASGYDKKLAAAYAKNSV